MANRAIPSPSCDRQGSLASALLGNECDASLERASYDGPMKSALGSFR